MPAANDCLQDARALSRTTDWQARYDLESGGGRGAGFVERDEAVRAHRSFGQDFKADGLSRRVDRIAAFAVACRFKPGETLLSGLV